MNQGEVAELKFIATLCCYISKEVTFKTLEKLIVNQVEIPIGDLKKAPKLFLSNVTPDLIKKLNEDQLQEFCELNGISKAAVFSKADIFINGIGYSIKYRNAAPPALVNHTRRTGWEFAAEKKGVPIAPLDAIVADYWQKRLSGIISEDVQNTHANSPFSPFINTLSPFLEYFIFEGTGTRLSKHPASEVIEFSDPCNFSTWELINRKKLIQNIWPRLVFSVRSGKGMPDDINSLTTEESNSVMLWAKNINGNLKGALHVRIKN